MSIFSNILSFKLTWERKYNIKYQIKIHQSNFTNSGAFLAFNCVFALYGIRVASMHIHILYIGALMPYRHSILQKRAGVATPRICPRSLTGPVWLKTFFLVKWPRICLSRLFRPDRQTDRLDHNELIIEFSSTGSLARRYFQYQLFWGWGSWPVKPPGLNILLEKIYL